jgi:cytidine deaminase
MFYDIDGRPTGEELHGRAAEAAHNSYSPYSGIAVGAALLTTGGDVFTATNVENASYSATLCAERSAVALAVSRGHREFEAIAVAGPLETLPPCGVCLQVLAEICGPDCEVVYRRNGELVTSPLHALLPVAFSFDPERST